MVGGNSRERYSPAKAAIIVLGHEMRSNLLTSGVTQDLRILGLPSIRRDGAALSSIANIYEKIRLPWPRDLFRNHRCARRRSWLPAAMASIATMPNASTLEGIGQDRASRLISAAAWAENRGNVYGCAILLDRCVAPRTPRVAAIAELSAKDDGTPRLDIVRRFSQTRESESHSLCADGAFRQPARSASLVA